MSFINNVAIIPARGGSKRIKKKNIKLFNNVNILSLTVSLIKKEKFFKKIYISTDDDKIKRIAKKLDLEIIHREKRLSGDFTSTIDVIKNAIKIINIKDKLNYICCIYPCNPFLNMSDVRKCYKIVKKNQNFVFPVVKYSHPIQRAFTLSKSGKIKPANKNSSDKRTQDLVDYYHDAGQFYYGNVKCWLNSDSIHLNAKGLPLPSYRVVDIDNVEDWKRAEKLHLILNEKKNK